MNELPKNNPFIPTLEAEQENKFEPIPMINEQHNLIKGDDETMDDTQQTAAEEEQPIQRIPSTLPSMTLNINMTVSNNILTSYNLEVSNLSIQENAIAMNFLIDKIKELQPIILKSTTEDKQKY